MKNAFLSRFTPSLMTPETLEAIFVQRHKLADDLVAAIRESAVTEKKHFHLLVGMRGMGKTHLIALIYHRIAKMDDWRDKLIIAWLREEEWGVSSFLDLLLRILRSLQAEYKAEYQEKLAPQVEAIYQLPLDEAEEKAAELLREFVGKRTLLLLMENLDDLFNGLGKSGQKKFRDYIENYSFLTILATAQCLFDAVGVKNYPFYGFFEIHELEEINLDEAIDLLAHIAAEADRELESFIRTPTGRDRIKAIHYLAGGNPRVYVIFSQFLTRKSLDELVEPFMKMLDDLTPYYQARMSWLSQQQRKVIEFLSDRRHAVTVKEIAQRCFITHQTASSQLKDLRDKGYVNSESIGRESFYELREPLMRFCFEVKKQRGEPIRLFGDFLRFWYSEKELLQRLESLPPAPELEREYLLQLLWVFQQENEDPRLVAWWQQYEDSFQKQDYVAALKLAEKLVKIRGHSQDWLSKGRCLGSLKRYGEALMSLDKAIELDPSCGDTWAYRGVVLYFLRRNNEALSSWDKAVDLGLNNAQESKIRAMAGIVLAELKHFEEALASFNKAIELNLNEALVWQSRGVVLAILGRHEEALKSYDKAIELNSDDALVWNYRGIVLVYLKHFQEALASYDKATELAPAYEIPWHFRSLVLAILGRHEEALKSYDKCIELDSNDRRVWGERGWILINLKRYDEALESLDKAIALGDQSSYVFFNRAISLLGLNRWDEGITTLDKAFNRLADGEKPDAMDSALIIRNLFNSTHDAAMWKNPIASLIEIYNKYQAVSVLGQGLVKRESLSALMSEMVSDKAAQTWLEVWRELVGDVSEFVIPLRLLNAAVRYKETKGDRRVLLELPIEERNLLQELLETSGD